MDQERLNEFLEIAGFSWSDTKDDRFAELAKLISDSEREAGVNVCDETNKKRDAEYFRKAGI